MVVPATDGAWTWHQDPRAVHINGSTYLGYVDSEGSIILYEFDHDTESATEVVLTEEELIDDHISPIIYQLPDDRFLIQYGRSETGIRQRISEDPGDISSFRDRRLMTTFNSNYPNPIAVGDDIHNYIRQDPGLQRNQYRFGSTDNGESWTKELQLTDFDERAYLKTAQLNTDRYYLALTSVTSSQPNKAFCIYYQDGSYHEADGTELASDDTDPLLSETDMDTLYQTDTDEFGALRVWDVVALDADDVRFLISDVDDPTDHEYYQLRWDGSSWSTSYIVDSGPTPTDNNDYYSGGLCYSGVDPDTVFLSQQVDGTHEIYTAEATSDSWSQTTVTDNSENNQWRPMRVRNAHPDLPVVWTDMEDYTQFTDYQQTVVSELDLSVEPTKIKSFNRSTSTNRRYDADSGSGRVVTDKSDGHPNG